MTTRNIQQEILFFTETTLAQFELRSTDSVSGSSSPTDQTEEALWNGMLFEIIPELILKNNEKRNPLFLWQVHKYSSSFYMNMSNCPDHTDQHFSIDPYRFIPKTFIN